MFLILIYISLSYILDLKKRRADKFLADDSKRKRFEIKRDENGNIVFPL